MAQILTHRMWNILFLLLTFLMLNLTAVPASAQVTLFSRQNFEGRNVNFETGDYSDLNRMLVNSGFDEGTAPANPTDPSRRRPPVPPALRVASIGSLRVAKGYQATLCRRNSNNGQTCRDFYHDIENVSLFLPPTSNISILNGFISLGVRRISWGIADLHTHPVNHMGFGAKINNEGKVVENGPFWGTPGENPDGATLQSDLARCVPDKHSGFTLNFVEHEARKGIIKIATQTTGEPHEAAGWPDFTFWPNALNPIHQQMHLSWIRRAYEGGLRFIVASAGDNQLISDVWNRRTNYVFGIYQRVREIGAEPEESWERIGWKLLRYVDDNLYQRVYDDFQESIRTGRRPGAVSGNPDDINLIRTALRDTSNYEIKFAGLEPGAARDPEYDFISAKRQLLEIKRLAELNSSWMKIVRTPGEARSAISENKLAIVLGTELDSLTPEQFFTLRRDYDLRVAIPIHLADNPAFGGAAVYGNQFNLLNYFLRKDFFKVRGDESLAFRLSAPAKLEGAGLPGWAQILGSILSFFPFNQCTLGCGAQPTAAERRNAYLLGYACCRSTDGCTALTAEEQRSARVIGCVPPNLGHRNARETNLAAFRSLMSRGLLVDLSHASHEAHQNVIELAENVHYPLLNSHTGLRDDLARSTNETTGCFIKGDTERAMTIQNAKRIRELGGVIGLGMATDPPGTTIFHQGGGPFVRFSGARNAVEIKLPHNIPSGTIIRRLHFRFRTGGDNLRGDNDNLHASVVIEEPDGSERISAERQMNNRAEWKNDTSINISVDMSELVSGREVNTNQIGAIRLRTTLCNGVSHDNWNMDELLVEAEDNSGQRYRLIHQIGAPAVRFRCNTPEVRFPVRNPVISPDTIIPSLRFTIRTGEDDLRDVHLAHLAVKLCNNEIRTFPIVPTPENGVRDENIFTSLVNLPPGTRLSQIIEAGVVSEQDGDQWKIDELKIEALIPETSPQQRFILKHVLGGPYSVVNKEHRDLMFDVSRGPTFTEFEDRQFRRLRVTWTTGGDDSRRDSREDIELKLRSGEIITKRFNDGAHWDNDTTGKKVVDFGRVLRYRDIESISIKFIGGFRGFPDTQDNWDLAELRLEMLGDPIKRWAADYLSTITKLGGKGMALGSDINGLERQIPYSEVEIDYSSGIRNGFNKAPDDVRASGTVRPLMRHRMGTKEYDIMNDGLAHYGLLPDLIAVAEAAFAPEVNGKHRNITGSPTLIDPLFRSAEDFISMWEKVIEVPENSQLRDRPKPVIRKLFVTIETGNQELKEDSAITGEVIFNDGSSGQIRLNFTTESGRARGVGWPMNSYRCSIIDVPSGKRIDQIQKIVIRYRPGASRLPFKIASVRVDYDSESLFVNSQVKRFTPHFEMTNESTLIEIPAEQR